MAVMRYLRIGNDRYEIADEKLKVSEITSGITYYPILGSGTANATSSRQWDSTGLQYDSFEGEEEGEGGNASLSLGNYIPVGETGSKRGSLILYGEEGSYSVLQSSTTGEGTGYYILLPNKQGTVALTDDVPTKVSQLENDLEFITDYTETDPTISAWAKAKTKPTYTAQEVGAISSVTVSRALVEGTKSATITVDGTSYDIYSKSGTITNIKTTAGAHTTVDVSSGAVSFNIPTTAAHVGIKFGYTTSGNNRAVLQDSSGNLYVTQKDDDTTYSAGTGLSLSSGVFSVKTGYTTSGNNRAVQADSSGNLYVVQTDNNTTYTAGTGLSLSSTTFSVKLGYTTSGNNRAVQADMNGNLYVVQKDDNTTYSSKAAASGGTDVSLVTTGEKYTWNSKTSNTGTVTSVAASGSGGITISGSPITSSGTITIGLNLSTAINGLGEGTSPAQLNDYAVVQYAGGGTTTTTYYRRKLTNLIVGKAVSDQNGLRIDTGYLKLTGGSVTGPTTFGDTVSIDDLNAGQLVVNGSISTANDLTVGGFINKFKIEVKTGLDANTLKEYNGLWISAQAITNAPTTGHSVLLGFRNIGTPFQLNIPDSNHAYIYKRSWDNTNAVWLSWNKLSAGYADSAGSATTCSYPAGFTGRSTGVTWGNTTGTSFTCWTTTNSGAIDFRYDNPSTGKLSVKVDGRFYFNEGNTPAAGLKLANSYWGLTGPDGEDNVWIRGTSQGFLPYQSGGAGSGHGSIGTSSWYWSNAYIDNINGAAYHRIYVSTSGPSGGSNGDVWFVYS